MIDLLPASLTTIVPPAWVKDWVADRCCFNTMAVEGAADLTDGQLRHRTADAYRHLLADLTNRRLHPLRFWNYVPGIQSPAIKQPNRYMVFNAGRYEAIRSSTKPGEFATQMATATGVGHAGTDLIIHCLSSPSPGTALNNPRQVAPYHYSKRFGTLPPCFARAVRITRSGNWLLVGGTAAIRGEDSVFREDLQRQIKETLLNLAALVSSARGEKYSDRPNMHQSLESFVDLRVYFPNIENQSEIVRMIRRHFVALRRLEVFVANLCRSELLVEVEGLARLPE